MAVHFTHFIRWGRGATLRRGGGCGTACTQSPANLTASPPQKSSREEKDGLHPSAGPPLAVGVDRSAQRATGPDADRVELQQPGLRRGPWRWWASTFSFADGRSRWVSSAPWCVVTVYKVVAAIHVGLSRTWLKAPSAKLNVHCTFV